MKVRQLSWYRTYLEYVSEQGSSKAIIDGHLVFGGADVWWYTGWQGKTSWGVDNREEFEKYYLEWKAKNEG